MERSILKNCVISGFADEIDSDVDKQIGLLKELGISNVEFRSGYGINVADYSIEQAIKLQEKFHSNGIKISAIGSPIGKIGILDDMDNCLKRLGHVAELAQIFETNYIRMFSFYIPEEKNHGLYRDEVLRRTEQMVKLAASKNLVLLHENEKGIYGDMAERCLDLMKNFYGTNYKCTFDFANFVQCRQDTMEAYEMLEPYIEYIHVKDALFETGEVVPAGMGNGKLREIFEKLDNRGYRGFLSLEPHLADFAGLKDLEPDAKERGRSDGEVAFNQAYQALMNVLK
jgi:sugar phosphate isomerase/epimerase